MRAIWKGSISFSLVNVPIALYPGTPREELDFRLLRRSDLSPVSYRRVAEADGKEVAWEDIVKGYEYEKGKFVVLKGKKLKGEWALVRLRSTGDNDEKNWLLMKTGSDASPISPRAKERSVLTGRTLKQVAEGKNAELDE